MVHFVHRPAAFKLTATGKSIILFNNVGLSLGKSKKELAPFAKRALNYRNLFDPAHKLSLIHIFLSYLKERHVKRVIDAGVDAIFMEAPEFWARAGYSESFQKEWKK